MRFSPEVGLSADMGGKEDEGGRDRARGRYWMTDRGRYCTAHDYGTIRSYACINTQEFPYREVDSFPPNSEQSARRRGRPAETSENYRNSHSGVQSSSTSPEGSPEGVVVRDSVPSFPLTKPFPSPSSHLRFSQTLRNYSSFTPRHPHRGVPLSYRNSGCCDTTSSHQISSSLVFYALSPTTEDTFRPCPALPRSHPLTCLRRSLPSQPYTGRFLVLPSRTAFEYPACIRRTRKATGFSHGVDGQSLANEATWFHQECHANPFISTWPIPPATATLFRKPRRGKVGGRETTCNIAGHGARPSISSNASDGIIKPAYV